MSVLQSFESHCKKLSMIASFRCQRKLCLWFSHKNYRWLIDSVVSHTITSYLGNLSTHSENDESDEVVVGDGSGLHVFHVDSLVFQTPTRTFHLDQTLCLPSIYKNWTSFHYFTSQNKVFNEFHPFYSLVEDHITGTTLPRGVCDNNVYTFSNSMVDSWKIVVNVHEQISIDGWHKRLGHPSLITVQNLLNSFSLPITKDKLSYLCTSCSISKAHI